MAISHGKAEKKAARTERLSAALRENLKRRKARARGRAGEGENGKVNLPAAGGAEPPTPDFRRNQGRD